MCQPRAAATSAWGSGGQRSGAAGALGGSELPPAGTAAEGERSGAEHAGLEAAGPAPLSSAMRRPPGAPGKSAPGPGLAEGGRGAEGVERGLRLGAPWAVAVETRPLPARPAAPPGRAVECPGRREESSGAVLEGGGVSGPPKQPPG